MRATCICFFMFQIVCITTLFGQGLKIADIRKDFKVGHKDEETCKKTSGSVRKVCR